MSLEVEVLKDIPTGQQMWDALGRIIPRAFAGTATRMAAAAPRGKTGKLSRRVQVVAKRISQGFVQGVEADFGVGVPYGHLVTKGHKIIARGPGRKGANKGALRTQLKNRRGAGALGFVPGNPFAERVFNQDRANAIRLIEEGLKQDLDAV